MAVLSAIKGVPDKPFSIMGIVNVTPDSFYDGGAHVTITSALDHARRLRDEGADIVDFGGASSRPGAQEVPAAEEIKRVIPVIAKFVKEFDGPVSIDTTSAVTAEAALEAGAVWVNDISAGRNDPRMMELVARRNCTLVLMHSRGNAATMQSLAKYDDVVDEVKKELMTQVKRFEDYGVAGDRIHIDPGIGFAKTAEQSIRLLHRLNDFVATGYRVVIGTSRKSFIGSLTGKSVEDRLFGTLGSVAAAFQRGATVFRVHDVSATKDLLLVLSAIEKV